MKDRLAQIKILEKELQKISKRIEVLESEINASYLDVDKGSRLSWERDDELAHKEEELKNLRVERDKLQAELEKLKNQN